MGSVSQGPRDNYRHAVQVFVELVDRIEAEQWPKPGLGDWTIRDLVGHTSRALLTVEAYLQPARTAQPAEHAELPDAVSYFEATAAGLADPAAVAARGRQAGATLGDDPPDAVRGIADRVLALLDQAEDDAVVATPAGTMTLAGYLPTRSFELVVHGLDLAAALHVAPPGLLAEPVASCLQLAAALAGRRPDSAQVLLALTGRQVLPAGFSVV